MEEGNFEFLVKVTLALKNSNEWVLAEVTGGGCQKIHVQVNKKVQYNIHYIGYWSCDQTLEQDSQQTFKGSFGDKRRTEILPKY